MQNSQNTRFSNQLNRFTTAGRRRTGRKIALRTAWTGVVESLEQRRFLAGEPTLNVTGTLTLNEGSSTTLTAAATPENGSTITRIEWDPNYNGSNFRPLSTGRTFRFNAANNGTRVVAARAIDNQNRVSTVITRTLTINDVNPTVTITSGANAGEGQTYSLTWRYTDPGTGGNDLVTSWSVNWGDGTIDNFSSSVPKNTIRTATHVYETDGSFTVTLTAGQQNGSHNATRVLAVAQVTPTVSVSTTDATINEGETATVQFSSPNRGQTIDGYVIDWGDGTTDFAERDLEEATHVYSEPGQFDVKVTAVELDGGIEGFAIVAIAVANAAPEATISSPPSNAEQGDIISFTSTASDAGDTDDSNLIYAWSVIRNGQAYDIDQAATNEAGFSFVARSPGTYRANLIVTDSANATVDVASSNFTVANVVPQGTMTAPANRNEGQAIAASVLVVDPGTNTHTYTWSVQLNGQTLQGVGSTTNQSGSAFSYTPDLPGAYEIFVTIADQFGGDSSTSAEVAVANVAPTGTASITPSTGVAEGDVVVATVSADDAGSTAELSYSWELLKDGNPFALPNGMVTTGSSFTFTPTDNGDWVARVSITDGVVTTVANSDPLTVANSAPVVAPSVTTNSPQEGVAVALVSGYTDVGAADTAQNATSFAWTVTRNGNAYTLPNNVDTTLPTLTFTPNDNGAYIASVVAVDKDGVSSDPASVNFTVANVAPTIPTVTGANLSYNEDATLSMQFSDSTDVANDTVEYRVIGSFTLLGAEDPSLAVDVVEASDYELIVRQAGTWQFTIRGIDEDGGASAARTINVQVNNVAPTVSASANAISADEGDSLSFNSSASDSVQDEPQLTYAWAVTRNGQPFTLSLNTATNGPTLNFISPDDGVYVATVTLRDNNNATDTDSATTTVSNLAPTGAVNRVGNAPVSEGDDVILNAVVTDAGANDQISYLWSLLKDGNPVTLPNGTITDGTSFTFTPTDNGTYVAVATVTDGQSNPVVIQSSDIVASNVNPTVAIAQQGSVRVEGTAVTVRATASDAGSSDTVASYAWTLTRDGNAVDVSAMVTNQQNFTFTPVDNGSYVATVNVTDDDNGAGTESITLVITNVAPVAGINGAPESRNEGQSVTATVSATDAGSLDTLTYAWQVFRNGSAQPYDLANAVANTASFTFTPREPGSYVLRATATDNDGGSDTAQVTVTVINLNPSVSVTGAPVVSINEGDLVTIDANAADPGGDSTLEYSWSVTRNGQPYSLDGNATATTTQLVFRPNDNGSYRARVEVADEQGSIGLVQSPVFTVVNVAPTVAITGVPVSAINEGTPVTLTAVVTDPGTADTQSLLWSLSRDGQSVTLPQDMLRTGQSFTFVPTDEGAWTASVVVTDDDNGTGSGTSSAASVVNVAPTPVITANGSNTDREGQAQLFTATATDPGSTDTVTFAWSARVGNNTLGTGTGASFSYTPTDDADVTIELTATDNDNGTQSITRLVEISNAAPVVSIVSPEGALTEGVAATFEGSFTDVAGDTTVTYAWTARRQGGNVFATASTANFTFTPPDNGTYIVELGVTDDGNATGTATRNASVANLAPTIAPIQVSDQTVNQGNVVTFSAAVSDVPADVAGLTYSWQLLLDNTPVQGSTSSQPTFTVTPLIPGNYTASLTVTDSSEASTTATRAMAVANIAPSNVAIAGLTSPINEGQSISLTASASDPSGADSLGYAWSVTRQGTQNPVFTQTGISLNYTPDRPGQYSVTLTARDPGNLATSVTGSLSVTNVTPTPVITANGSNTDREGQAQLFTASASDPGGADTVTFAWAARVLGDVMATGTGASFSYTPTDDADVTIELTATDNDNGTQSITRLVEISNAAPVVSIVSPEGALTEGVAATFEGSFTDVAGDTGTYAWTARRQGGNVFATASTANFTFTPPDNGTYVVELEVTDDDNATGTATRNVSVANLAPTIAPIQVSDQSVNQGNVVTFSAAVSDVPADVAGLTYSWQLLLDNTPVEGFTGSEPTFTVTPLIPGNYTASLTVTDSSEASTSATREMDVANIAPSSVVIQGSSSSINEGQAISLTASASDPSGADSLGYVWSVSREGAEAPVFTQTGISLNFTPDRPGQYSVSLTARDPGDLATSVTRSIPVANVAPTIGFSDASPTRVRPFANSVFGAVWTDPGTGSVVNATYTLAGSSVATNLGTGASGSQTFTRAFSTLGSSAITLSVNDGTTTTTAVQNVDVSNAFVGTDPNDATLTTAIFSGTAGADVINISSVSGGRFRATINSVNTAIFNAGTTIALYGHGGNDRITINNDVGANVFVDAGEGNDTVTTSTGNDFVLGGNGNDSITTGAGRDVIYGGAGTDTIDAGAGEDLVVGSDVAASQSYARIRTEWASDRSFASRIDRLRSSATFGDTVINNSTVSLDNAADSIVAGADNDWVIGRGTPADVLTGFTSSDRSTAL